MKGVKLIFELQLLALDARFFVGFFGIMATNSTEQRPTGSKLALSGDLT